MKHIDRKQKGGNQVRGAGKGELVFSGNRFHFCKMKKTLEEDGGDGHSILWLSLTLKNH